MYCNSGRWYIEYTDKTEAEKGGGFGKMLTLADKGGKGG